VAGLCPACVCLCAVGCGSAGTETKKQRLRYKVDEMLCFGSSTTELAISFLVGSKELPLWLFNWCFSLLLFVQGKGRQKGGRRLISLGGTCVALKLKSHHAVEDVILKLEGACGTILGRLFGVLLQRCLQWGKSQSLVCSSLARTPLLKPTVAGKISMPKPSELCHTRITASPSPSA